MPVPSTALPTAEVPGETAPHLDLRQVGDRLETLWRPALPAGQWLGNGAEELIRLLSGLYSTVCSG